MSSFDLGWVYLALAGILGTAVSVRVDTDKGKMGCGEMINVLLLSVLGAWLEYLALATWFGWWPR